jgi:DNA-binding CsgD family transcriptional regulator
MQGSGKGRVGRGYVGRLGPAPGVPGDRAARDCEEGLDPEADDGGRGRDECSHDRNSGQDRDPSRRRSGAPQTDREQQEADAHRLAAEDHGRFGYLLKDRVLEVDEFLDALTRVAKGGSVLDPEVVGRLVGAARQHQTLAGLTPREREILALIAEGRTNAAIAQHLVVSERTVETHVANIIGKLGIEDDDQTHRRVVAALAYFRATAE